MSIQGIHPYRTAAAAVAVRASVHGKQINKGACCDAKLQTDEATSPSGIQKLNSSSAPAPVKHPRQTTVVV